MAPVEIPLSELHDWIGREVGTSEWCLIDQARIDAFAQCTEDFQFIHLDPEAARSQAGFAGTIAHGFLVLSMLSSLAYQAGLKLKGARVSINYGFDKIRFVNPVLSGSAIRARFVLAEVVERQPGQWLLAYDVRVEVKDSDKPALVARWLTLLVVGA